MIDKTKTLLSKSKYIEGLKCSKLLWCEFNNKSIFPPVDSIQQVIFDSGTKVGEVAQQLFPDGIKIERDLIPEQQHKKSIEALKLNKPLFEAGFIFERTYSLADILVPAKDGFWDLYEVKSSTEIKDVYYSDIAFQKYTYENAGVKIRKCFLMHINNQYVRQGDIELDKLFISEDVTNVVGKLQKNTAERITKILEIMSWSDMPDVQISSDCDYPYPCPLKSICWDFLPDKNNVFALSRGKIKAFDLVSQGIYDITNIPIETKLTDKQYIQVECHKSGKVHIDRKAIKDFLNELKYPLYFLDFETIGLNLPIPEYDYSKPYEQIPFQFSLHILKDKDSAPEHHAYLAEGTSDPRPVVLEKLKGLLGDSGSIVAYNAGFEINKIKSSAEVFPKFKKWFLALEKRFIDLWWPFRSFAYYNPSQDGSASMKAVLPAIAGISYDEMEIGSGGLASNEYYRVTFNSTVSDEDRLKVRAALEKYCALDTSGMIDIIRALEKESREVY